MVAFDDEVLRSRYIVQHLKQEVMPLLHVRSPNDVNKFLRTAIDESQRIEHTPTQAKVYRVLAEIRLANDEREYDRIAQLAVRLRDISI